MDQLPIYTRTHSRIWPCNQMHLTESIGAFSFFYLSPRWHFPSQNRPMLFAFVTASFEVWIFCARFQTWAFLCVLLLLLLLSVDRIVVIIWMNGWIGVVGCSLVNKSFWMCFAIYWKSNDSVASVEFDAIENSFSLTCDFILVVIIHSIAVAYFPKWLWPHYECQLSYYFVCVFSFSLYAWRYNLHSNLRCSIFTTLND